MDSVGVGELPDAARYGDEGSNTRREHRAGGSASKSRRCGRSDCRRIVDIGGARPAASGAFGRMAERSAGKDSVTGHWEMMGVVLDRPFPTFPHGFPADAHRGVRTPHRPPDDREHRGVRAPSSSRRSAPSTCAPARRSSTPRPTACFRSPRTRRSSPLTSCTGSARRAFDLVGRGLGVGRVIARPFVGEPGHFVRTANRRDFALEPFGPRCSIG